MFRLSRSHSPRLVCQGTYHSQIRMQAQPEEKKLNQCNLLSSDENQPNQYGTVTGTKIAPTLIYGVLVLWLEPQLQNNHLLLHFTQILI